MDSMYAVEDKRLADALDRRLTSGVVLSPLCNARIIFIRRTGYYAQ